MAFAIDRMARPFQREIPVGSVAAFLRRGADSVRLLLFPGRSHRPIPKNDAAWLINAQGRIT